jgi:hypothetical protein
MSRPTGPKPVLGWREWITLPELGPIPIKAKVDTGARTSALHAFGLKLSTTGDGMTLATFELHPRQRSSMDVRRVEIPVTGFRSVRSSNGHREDRPVITTPIQVGPHSWTVDLTLTSRDEMGFRMLLGRAAVRRRFLIDPGKSFQQGDRS